MYELLDQHKALDASLLESLDNLLVSPSTVFSNLFQMLVCVLAISN